MTEKQAGRQTKDEVMTWVNNQPNEAWQAPEGKSVAVLYSGYQGQNHRWAVNDCAGDSPRYSIGDTTAGKQLEGKELYKADSGLNREEADAVWNAASARFAQNINGPAETHIVSSDRTRVARETELPEFLENTNATSINGIPKDALDGMSDKEKYYAIARTEVDQAKERAAVNPTLSERAEHKEAGLQAVYARDMAADAQRLGSQSTTPAQEGRVEIPPAPNDNIHPRTGLPGNAPREIPPPNESFDNLQSSAQSRHAPSASAIPAPADSIPAPAASPPPIANDNTLSGPN